MNWVVLAVWFLALSPIYLWVASGVISRAYFKAKLQYHHELFTQLKHTETQAPH